MQTLPATVALAVLALSSADVAAQVSPPVTDEIEVREVLLDVVVTDRADNIIIGLGPEDFVVEVAGQRVELSGATFYSNRRFLTESGIGQETETPVDRYFVLFFHEDPGFPTIVLRERQEAIRRAKQWVSEELLANDWVAVASYRFKLQIYQDFTTDPAAIQRALDRLLEQSDPGDTWPSRLDRDGGPSLRSHLPQGRELRSATTRIYSGLEVLARAAGTVRGRKNLLLFSPGFGEPDGLGFFVPDRRYFPRTVRTLNENNVSVYGISLIQNPDVRNAVTGSPDNALSALATRTGGRAYFTFASYRVPLDSAAADTNGYYLISFAAPAQRLENGYRRVTVRTVNPEFRVRGRRGYGSTGD